MALPVPVELETRSLRIRLTVSYILLLSLVLASIGLVFKQILTRIVREQAEQVLTEEWGALLAYLRLEDGRVAWTYDREDPEQAFTLQRLQGVLLVADSEGRILEMSNGYQALGGEQAVLLRDVIRSPAPRFLVRHEPGGDQYLVRIGRHRERGRDYAVALGMPMPESSGLPERFLRIFFLVSPVLLLSIGLLGWFAVRRALEPLKRLAEAARSVSEGNLGMRIPQPKTEDEVGHLVVTFNRMMDRLEATFHQIRQFTVDASHELRTPLTAVRGQLEVALLTAQTPEQYRESIVAALQDVEKLSQITKTLVYLARAESGQIAPMFEREDLAEIVLQVLSVFEAPAEEKRIQLETDLAAGCVCEADRAMIEQLIYQLVSNAVNFTQEGGKVKVALSRKDGGVEILVKDNGPGIGKEHLARIFERFYRIRSGQGNGASGAGLGLPLASWIAHAHGGRIEVRSEEGMGTVFTVNLPADRG